MKVVLASASPRRKELLSNVYRDFTVIKPSCEETVLPNPVKTVKNLSRTKADCIDADFDILISADTIVVQKGKILGKPKDKTDAYDMLSSLQGKTHKVLTGVTIKYSKNGKIHHDTFCVTSRVLMKKMSDNDIITYINTGSPLDKAGSYGIQDGVVDSYRGSYTNIVGLPIEKLTKKLKHHHLIQEEL